MIGIYVLAAIVVLALIFVKKTIVIIPQSETKIIERLGRYYATLRPGINIIIPFIDRAKDIVAMRNGRYMYTNTIDLREQVYDFDRQNVITKDNIQMQINALPDHRSQALHLRRGVSHERHREPHRHHPAQHHR